MVLEYDEFGARAAGAHPGPRHRSTADGCTLDQTQGAILSSLMQKGTVTLPPRDEPNNKVSWTICARQEDHTTKYGVYRNSEALNSHYIDGHLLALKGKLVCGAKERRTAPKSLSTSGQPATITRSHTTSPASVELPV